MSEAFEKFYDEAVTTVPDGDLQASTIWNAAVDAVVEALRRRAEGEKVFRSKFIAEGVLNDILQMKVK